MGGSPKGTHQNLIAIVLVAEVLEGFPGGQIPTFSTFSTMLD